MFPEASKQAAAMRYVLAVAIMTVLLAAPVRAQMKGMAPEKTPLDFLYERQKLEQEENERAYNAQMKRLKAQGSTTTSDPWKGVRPANEAPAKR